MMPIDFPGSNCDMVKPANMSADECGDLRVQINKTYRGPQFRTCWAPSYEDIKSLNANKALVVELHSNEYIYVSINTRYLEYPAILAHKHAIVWIPGTNDLADIKSGKPIYITFVCDAFPVVSVYIKED